MAATGLSSRQSSPPRGLPNRQSTRASSAIETWAKETSITRLEAGLDQAASYAERTVILHRLRTLRRGDTKALDLVRQRIDQYMLNDLEAHPRELRAVFLERSLLADHIAYLWATPGRELESLVRQASFKSQRRISCYNIPKTLTPPAALNNSDRQAWTTFLGRLTRRGMIVKGTEPTRHDVETHIAAYSGIIHAQASAAYLKRLADYLWSARGNKVRCIKKYRDSKEYTYHALADVTVDQEEVLIQRLIAEGAKIRANKMNIPTYQSQHLLSPGKRFSLKLVGGGALHYVPHYSIGTKRVERFRHQVSVQLSPQRAQKLKREILDHYRSFTERPKSMLIGTRRGEDYLIPLDRLHGRERARASAAVAKQSACMLTYFTRGRRAERYQLRHTTPDDLRHAGYVGIGGGLWLPIGHAQEYRKARRAIDEILDGQGPRELPVWENDQNYPQGVRDPLMEPVLRLALRQLAFANQVGLARLTVKHLVEVVTYSVTPTQGREPIPHRAPFSERGVLRFENIDPRQFVSLLGRLGLAQGAVCKVPYQTIYRGSHRRGRVTTIHHEYASGKKQLPSLPGKMVIHGMTGVYDDRGALARLCRLQQGGGLKSIAERRRMGIKVVSLSPKGDIASGIDMGVSAKIGDYPEYGSHIIFGMNPAILERRDLWLSNCDFGAGAGRYDKYTAYARKIGQGKIYLPPSHAARSQHLKHGIGGSDNEVYFKHEISLDEIEVLFIKRTGGLDSKVQVLVDTWKKQGSPGGHLLVVPFGSTSSFGAANSNIVTAVETYLKQSPAH